MIVLLCYRYWNDNILDIVMLVLFKCYRYCNDSILDIVMLVLLCYR